MAALTNKDLGLNDWVGLVLKCGETNLRAMELLDAGNTGKFGHPVPTEVPLGHKLGTRGPTGIQRIAIGSGSHKV